MNAANPPHTQSHSQIGSISLAAVGAAILAIASVLGCVTSSALAWLGSPNALVLILALPVPAFLGAILGAIALRNISRARGALGGRVMALIGLFLGISSGVIQGAAAGGALATWWPVKKIVAPVIEQLAFAIQKDDLSAARALLSPSAAQVVTDEQLRDLLRPSRQKYGNFRAATFGLDVFVDSFKQVSEGAQRAANSGAAPGTLGGPADPPKPVGLAFERGRVMAYIFVDQAALDRETVQILDMLVVPKQAPARALLPDGPARQAARAMAIELEALPEPAAPAEASDAPQNP